MFFCCGLCLLGSVFGLFLAYVECRIRVMIFYRLEALSKLFRDDRLTTCKVCCHELRHFADGVRSILYVPDVV